MTKTFRTDNQNTLPQGNASQVAGYPGTGGRMLSEWVAGYSGIRILSDELQVSPPEIRLWGDLHGHVAAKP
jgi:hypothetical protein